MHEMMKQQDQPSVVVSTALVASLVIAWGYVRILAFHGILLPLTFVVPMLVCVWTRRAWQLWAMAAMFTVMTTWKVSGIPDEAPGGFEFPAYIGAGLFNIVAGAVAIQLILLLRNQLDERNARLAAQNAELEMQAEELAQQNEEIKVQTEELAQQNEEIGAQAEELTGQNEELQAVNERLGVHEEILQMLLESARGPDSDLDALGNVCRRSLHAIGKPTECVAILCRDGDRLRVQAQASSIDGLEVPAGWPVAGSIAGIVLHEEKTAYVSDLGQQPEVSAPFGASARVRSILATPIVASGQSYGLLIACSTLPGHWTQAQFQAIEWIAAQCGLIAESIRWRHELTQRAKEIEAANHAKDQFLAMLSHELRTPLTPVLAAAGVLEGDERLPADVRADLGMVRRNVAIQSRLVDDLLDLTRLGRGKVDLDLQHLELATLLRETARIVEPDLAAREQSVELRLGGLDGCRVHGDGPRLQQVFWNLLKNAIKFSPPDGRIAVAARSVPATGRVVVEVTDAGIGIDGSNIERIFRPFEQVTAEGRRGGGGGLGLGLAIAKAIVELHRGTIRVVSDGVGRGTTFIVELPVAKELPAAAGRSQHSGSPLQPPSAETAPLRILLVEDHYDTGRVVARLLRNAGYHVEHAASAGVALTLFRDGPFDLLLSDLGLPDESGVELMRELRALQPDLRGICLSGFGMENDLAACREAGFAEHLTKPVDIQRLHAAIARVTKRGATNT
jgi:signal transduction histidine kinase/ActR/RegA family two-component response regulator